MRWGMRLPIHLNPLLGSSVTTVAGFVALCVMTFALGRDLGIVMAKGVIIGVYLLCNNPSGTDSCLLINRLRRHKHKPLIQEHG